MRAGRTDIQMLKAEKFSAPSASQYSNGVTYTASCHGNSGPLGIQYDPDAYALSFFPSNHLAERH